LYPRLRGSVALAWAASILIDVDHYLWFVARHKRLNPATAARAFNSANAPTHAATRLLHNPAVVLTLLLLARRRRIALLTSAGMTFHIILDTYHRARTARAQAASLNRDRRICRVCTAEKPDVVAHVWRQPPLLPSYRLDDFVTLCDQCHESAHRPGTVAIVRPGTNWDVYRADVMRRLPESQALVR
jgi:hypothetical protein